MTGFVSGGIGLRQVQAYVTAKVATSKSGERRWTTRARRGEQGLGGRQDQGERGGEESTQTHTIRGFRYGCVRGTYMHACMHACLHMDTAERPTAAAHGARKLHTLLRLLLLVVLMVGTLLLGLCLFEAPSLAPNSVLCMALPGRVLCALSLPHSEPALLRQLLPRSSPFEDDLILLWIDFDMLCAAMAQVRCGNGRQWRCRG